MKNSKRGIAALLVLTMLCTMLPGISLKARAAELDAETEPVLTEAAQPESTEAVQTEPTETEPAQTEPTETVPPATEQEEPVPETPEETIQETQKNTAPKETIPEATAPEETTVVEETVETLAEDSAEEETNIASGTCGEGLTWVLDASYTLTISGSGEMTSREWSSYASSIQKLSIEEGVTSIVSYAFSGCSSLTSVTIPASVVSIDTWAFYNCSSLTSVTLSDNITSIGNYTFYRCGKLDNVIIPDGVTSIGNYAFGLCYALTSVTIPASVTAIGDRAFNWCYGLTEVTFPDNLTSIGAEAFYNCWRLTSVSIPAAVSRIGSNAFSSCDSLTGIWVDSGNANYSSDPSGVLFNKSKTILMQAPCGLSGDYEIPDTVVSIDKDAFDGVSLSSLLISASVASVGEGAFSSYALKKIVFFGDVPAIDSTSQTPTIFYDSSYYIAKVFYPADNETWTESAKQALNPNPQDNFKWFPFDTNRNTSGSCGTGLTWSVDETAKTLSISGNGAMDSWDWTDSFAPWIYFFDKIETIVIEAGVTSVSDDAFLYTNGNVIRFKGDAPSIGSNVLESSSITVYYPAGNETWTEVIQRYPTVTWIQEESAFAGLHDIVNAYETMTDDEIRAAVQALDQEELLNSMRSGEALDDIYTLDAAVQADYPNIVVTSAVPELYGMSTSALYWYVTGASLNDLISTEESVTLTLDKPGTEIPVPEGYESDEAIQFSLSLSNLQNPACLEVPVSIEFLLPDSMNSFFVGIFWRNNETGQIEEIPSYCFWTKVGGIRLSFVITGTGDYLIVPKHNGSVGGTCGDNLTWTYDDTSTLTISGSGAMNDYGKTSNLAPWAYYREDVNYIVIGEEVTHIGAYAFYDCRFADKITIPAGVQDIGAGAFSGLFTSIIVFEGDAPGIADDSFSGMQASAYYPSGNPTWDGVITQEEWGGAYGLIWTEIVTSGPCGENQTWTFDEQTGVLTISGTGEMTNYDFYGEDTAPWRLYNDTITKVILEDGVTSIGVNTFSECVNMTEIVIPDSVTSIYEFSICTSSMKELTIPANVTTLDIWSGIAGLDRIDVAEENPAYTSVDGILFDKDKTTLLCCPQSRAGEYQIPEGVITIGQGAFQCCKELTKLMLPNTLTTICQTAIYYCTGLTELTIPDSVTTIDFMAISCCYGLKTVTIGAGVTSIGAQAFEYCRNLSKIIFEGDAPEIGDDAFESVMTTAYYPSGDNTWTDDVKQNYGGTITWRPFIPGDLNGDGNVDLSDAADLLWYTFFTEDNTLIGKTDFNHDGETDSGDVVYLLWHILFPELFPL